MSWCIMVLKTDVQNDVFCLCRENLGQWEKIARGEVEDVVPTRTRDSGPVKVDNWVPKGFLAHQRNRTCILPRPWNFVLLRGGGAHIVSEQQLNQLKATWLYKNTRLPHRVTEVSTLAVSPITQTDWQLMELRDLTRDPASTQFENLFGRMDLCLFWLFYYYVSFLWLFYGLVFAEALLWTFCRQYVKSCWRFNKIQLYFIFLNGTVCLLW